MLGSRFMEDDEIHLTKLNDDYISFYFTCCTILMTAVCRPTAYIR